MIFKETLLAKIVVEMAPKVNHLTEFFKKIEFPIHLIAYIILGVVIAYEQQVSDSLKSYGPNPFFRIISFIILLAVALLISPLHALLLALVIVLFVSFTPGYNTEGYEDTQLLTKKKHRWFDEEVLSENPIIIQSERVVTQAPNS